MLLFCVDSTTLFICPSLEISQMFVTMDKRSSLRKLSNDSMSFNDRTSLEDVTLLLSYDETCTVGTVVLVLLAGSAVDILVSMGTGRGAGCVL